MPRKISIVLVTLLLLSLPYHIPQAAAEASAGCVTKTKNKGNDCAVSTTVPGRDAGQPPAQPPVPVAPAQPPPSGVAVREECNRLTPQPPIDSREGIPTRDGAYFFCTSYDSGNNIVKAGSRWIPKDQTPPSADKPPVDMKKLAEVATAKLHLDVPQVGIVPKAGKGVIGVPVWLWVGNPTLNTVGPITDTASEGEATVKIRARLGKIVWNMGDGTTITCGQGTPWKPSYGKDPSPTCGHVYQKIGTYAITGTVFWVVDWEGEGQHGTLTPTLTTAPVTLDMKDVQVLNVNPNR